VISAGIATLITLLLFFAVRWIPFLAVSENWSADIRLALLAPPSAQSDKIVLLTITEETLATLPVRSPIDRGFLARLINNLGERGVAAIGIDLLFDQASEPQKDRALKQAIENFDGILVAAFADQSDGLSERQSQYLRKYLANVRKGRARLVKDELDGVVRWAVVRSNGGKNAINGFAASMATALGIPVSGKRLRISFRPRDAEGKMPFPNYMAHMAHLLPRDWLQGKIVLIGADRSGIDRFRTAMSADIGSVSTMMAGVEIHAHALDQLIEGRTLAVAPAGFEFLLIFVLAALGILLVQSDASVPSQLGLGSLAMLLLWLVGGTIFAFDGPLIPLLSPSLGFVFAGGVGAAFFRGQEREEKKFIRNAFAQFLSPAVVNRLVSDPRGLKLGGEKRELTLIFTDVTGFTSLTEQLPADGPGHDHERLSGWYERDRFGP
jgi:CHASE2 domain-containing sensor protein